VINFSVSPDTHIIEKCTEEKQFQIRKLQFDLLRGLMVDLLHLSLENTWSPLQTKRHATPAKNILQMGQQNVLNLWPSRLGRLARNHF